MEHVILVDQNDQALGTMEKMEAHEKGELHRAFSVFLFNGLGECMLQKRATHKYHSGGLWTNTCCSHPRPDEAVLDAANRRLQEEMGMSATFTEAFTFIYHAPLDHNLIEHELDHVLIGKTEAYPVINPEEVAAWKFMSPAAITADLKANPSAYTVWFRTCFEQVVAHLEA